MSANGRANRQAQAHIPHSPIDPSASSYTQVAGTLPSQDAPDTPMPPPHRSAPPSSDGVGRREVEALVLQEFLKKVWSCNTIGDLIRLIPVPAQPISRNVLDGVYQACQKLGAAEALLNTWRDVLRSGTADALKQVAQLNSIRAPTVQVCKEALQVEADGGLSKMNFDATLFTVKTGALRTMIEIKTLEVDNLRAFVQPQAVCTRLRVGWDAIVRNEAASLTPEHVELLNEGIVMERVTKTATSIGQAAYTRVKLAKKERVVVRKDTDVDMTDVSGPEGRKQLKSVVGELMKQHQQSRRDRAQSGKERRSSGVSKTKKKTPNQKRKPKKKKGPRKDGKQTKGPGAKRRERR